MTEEDQLKRSVKETLAAIRSTSAVLATGKLAGSEALKQVLWQIHTAAINALAIARGLTPREILEESFKDTPDDEAWRSTTLPAMKRAGEKLLAGDDVGLPPPSH